MGEDFFHESWAEYDELVFITLLYSPIFFNFKLTIVIFNAMLPCWGNTSKGLALVYSIWEGYPAFPSYLLREEATPFLSLWALGEGEGEGEGFLGEGREFLGEGEGEGEFLWFDYFGCYSLMGSWGLS